MDRLIFDNAAILDVPGGTLIDGGSVLVEDGRIVEVAERAVHVADGHRIDLAGRVLMPGLSDAHVHVTAATPNFPELMHWSPFYTGVRAGGIMQAMLMRGFTTVRDAGGADYGLARAVEEGHIVGPRLLFCGKALSQTGGHGDMRGPGENYDICNCGAGLGRICDGVPAVRQACRDEIRKGATHIKVMASGGVSSPTDRITNTQFSLEEITASVEEAEAAGLYVMAHAYTPQAIRRAVECGVRSVEHCNLIDADTMDLVVDRGAFVVPTMSTHEALAREGVEAGMPKDMCDKVFQVIDAGKRNFPEAWRRGVKLVLGTDLLGSMHAHQLRELALRGEFQAPIDVIRSATTVAAELFGLEGEIGVVAPGARADLLVVDGNPLDDLGVLQDPDRRLQLIMKDGKIFKNEL